MQGGGGGVVVLVTVVRYLVGIQHVQQQVRGEGGAGPRARHHERRAVPARPRPRARGAQPVHFRYEVCEE
ncbi:unnamed protein product, partial [Brenthis ino]